MASYQSKFSGPQIDEAVAYFNAIEKEGRTVLTSGINAGTSTGGWAESINASDKAFGNYYAEITAEGVFNIQGASFNKPPEVYFVQGDPYGTIGSRDQKWDLDYVFIRVGGSITKIKCYSNIPLAGTFVIVSVLSTSFNSGAAIVNGDLMVTGKVTIGGNIIQNDNT